MFQAALAYPGAATELPASQLSSPAAEPAVNRPSSRAAELPERQLFSPAAGPEVSQPSSRVAEPPANQPFSVPAQAPAADLLFGPAVLEKAPLRFSVVATAVTVEVLYPGAAAERVPLRLIPAVAGVAGAARFNAVRPVQAGVQLILQEEAAAVTADQVAGRFFAPKLLI